MTTFRTVRRVRHSALDMFKLVADCERYPQFLPWCQSCRIRRRLPSGVEGVETVIADMTVGFRAIRETFTSRATFDIPKMLISVEYLDGPFSHLENSWSFKTIDEKQTEVHFFITYEFRSRALSLLMGAMFDAAFRKFSEAFEHRADQLYGRNYRGISARS
ncbi:type II toxin-antitoxin system RatA family toxin [Blastochloris sulfoviridis]|uniref:Type II toxin-antitoxin system RatA family toxin n=1 Tax=Blastochloris sulfoviridis TaxID=50712 RepID=A0A5M6I0E1_9HYPH|nr:type II toxin-antitoxin system RatA family toxin [Blastochloris sulfoviridis]